MKNYLPHQGEVYFVENFLTQDESDYYMEKFIKDITWKHEPIMMFGKEIMQPRLTSFYGDRDKTYTYSKKMMIPNPWSHDLIKLKTKLEKKLHTTFSSVLLNYYRDGRDYMGWHRDNEPELGERPIIASLSLGANRSFHLREYKSRANKVDFELTHGSLLVMKGETQKYWEHALPKRLKVNETRINLTFRSLI